jgi:hypothetical protein
MTANSAYKADFSGWETRLDPSLGPSAKLCTPCQSFFDKWDSWLNPGRLFPHHQHPAELQSAASNHCPLCYQFWKNGPRVHQIDQSITDVSMIGTHELLGIHVQRMQHQHPETSIAEEYFRLGLKFIIPKLGGRSTIPSYPPLVLDAIDATIVSTYSRQDPLVFGEYCVALHPTRRSCMCKHSVIV